MDRMNNMYYVKCKVYSTSDSLWERFYDQGVMDASIHKLKYHWVDFPWNIKIKVKGNNISIVYSVLVYKLKVIHDEYDTLNFTLWDITEINIPGKKKTVAMISLFFLQMTVTSVTQ